jgi:hypothetical protein
MTRLEREALHAAMVRLADGDRSAFEPVYRALWPLLLRFAGRALGEDEAELAVGGALAAMAGAMGCVPAGAGGVLAMAAAMVATAAPQAMWATAR